MKHSLSKIFEAQKLKEALNGLVQELTREEYTRVYSTSSGTNLNNALALREILNGKPVPKHLRNQYNHTHAIKRLQHEFQLKVHHHLFIRCMKYYTTLKSSLTHT